MSSIAINNLGIGGDLFDLGSTLHFPFSTWMRILELAFDHGWDYALDNEYWAALTDTQASELADALQRGLDATANNDFLSEGRRNDICDVIAMLRKGGVEWSD